jgi:hypothetical protein
MGILAKQFGDYKFNTCTKTGFICAKNILETYNETAKTPKKLKDLSKYIKRANFFKEIIADFNQLARDGKINNTDLKKIDENFTGDSMPPVNIEDKSHQIDILEEKNIINTYIELPKQTKFDYMIRQDFTMRGTMKKINSILVHPMSAVGIAMWMSPEFGSKVKDIFLRFIEGDAKLIQQTLQNLNISTGKVNNIETAADPDTNEISMIVSTFEKNDYMAKIKNQRMKNAIQQLLDEKNGVITEQKCKIDELLIKMDIEGKKADEERKKADEERKKADERDRIQSEKINKLLGYSIETKTSLDSTKTILIETKNTLNNVLPQRVETNELNNGRDHQVIILHDRDAKENEYNLYVIRAQTRSIQNSIDNVKDKYGNNIHRLYTINQPNAVAFWNVCKKKLVNNIYKDNKTNWFCLKNMSLRQFKDRLNDLNKTRCSP